MTISIQYKPDPSGHSDRRMPVYHVIQLAPNIIPGPKIAGIVFFRMKLLQLYLDTSTDDFKVFSRAQKKSPFHSTSTLPSHCRDENTFGTTKSQPGASLFGLGFLLEKVAMCWVLYLEDHPT